MNYNFSETVFPSKDGAHTIYAEIYTPKHCPALGIVQISHGMIDYVGRYKYLIEYLTGEGYIVAGHHHLGHGKSVTRSEDYGFFAENDGDELVVRDMHTMNRYLRDTFPALPLVVMGHSMGSFITRLYVERYPHSMQGVIIHGTSGPNPLLPMGGFLASVISKLRGARYRSRLLKKLAFGSYNKKFPKSDGADAWLTREVDLVADRPNDKYTNFIFTASGYRDLFKMIRECNSDAWFKEYPKAIPTLIMSGDMDPVGNYGKGPDYVYKNLLIAGCSEVSLKLYPGARHELFLETEECRKEAFSDMVSWLRGIK